MTTDLHPPPEGLLIARLREAAPRQSIRQAAARAGISESRWRQIEYGVRRFRGVNYPEKGPAQAVAKMAEAVGATPEELTAAGRPDAAAELAALLALIAASSDLTGRQKDVLSRLVQRDVSSGETK